tara:strand:- start:1717 stop:2115 length:399 start_codon:yes stop_codon:yes gene_type:complete
MKIRMAYTPAIVALVTYLYSSIPTTRPLLFIHCFCILLAGLIDTCYKKKKYGKSYKNNIAALVITINLLIIVPILYYRQIIIPNNNSHYLLLFILIFSRITPLWPYTVSKKIFMRIYGFCYLFIFLLIKLLR